MRDSYNNCINKYKTYFFLFVMFLIINIFLFYKIGIKVVTDSPRYLDYADQIINTGNLYQDHNVWYIGYVLLIVVAKCISSDPSTIVLFQIFFSWFAVLALYNTSQLLFSDTNTSIITTVYYLGFIEISSWNFYVLAESFYSSMICFSIYFLVKAYFKPTYSYIFTAFSICLVASITKPTGIALWVGVLLLLYYKYRQIILSHNRYVPIVAILFVFIGGYFIINRMLQSFMLIESYEAGEIVYGIISLPGNAYTHYLTVKVDCDKFIFPSPQLSPIARILLFIYHNPILFLKLTTLKLFWFLAHIKPYFTWIHNIFIAIVLYPLYIFYAVALNKTSFDFGIKLFLSTIVLFNCFIVALTSEDWDGRFITPILPVIFLVAANGMSDRLAKLSRRIYNSNLIKG